MSAFRSDDPMRDFAKREREMQEWENSLPRCDSCGEMIEDYVFDIDGEILCIECMIAKYRREAEDYCS